VTSAGLAAKRPLASFKILSPLISKERLYFALRAIARTFALTRKVSECASLLKP